MSDVDPCKVYFRNLPVELKHTDVATHLGDCGFPMKTQLRIQIVEKESWSGYKSGFIHFTQPEHAALCISLIHGTWCLVLEVEIFIAFYFTLYFLLHSILLHTVLYTLLNSLSFILLY